MRHVRQVTRWNDPKREAVWILAGFYEALSFWSYEFYDTERHPTLGESPRHAWEQGLVESGQREHRLIAYDEAFLMNTRPTTRTGVATVQTRGVKINNIWYWSDTLRDPGALGTQVPVRTEPFDVGVAFVMVRGQWTRCISEYYAELQGHSERELFIAGEELRQRDRITSRDSTLSAARLAKMISSNESAAVRAQRERDQEARTIRGLATGVGEALAQQSEANSSDPTSDAADAGEGSETSPQSLFQFDGNQLDMYERL